MVARGRIIGTLNTAVNDGAAYFPEVEQFLLQIASVLASIIERDRLYKEAVVANNTKTIFLSQMTHELRTPLNGGEDLPAYVLFGHCFIFVLT